MSLIRSPGVQTISALISFSSGAGLVKKLCLLSLIILLLPACATLNMEYPRTASHALDDVGDTRLARKIDPVATQHPGESGFMLLSNGLEALAARLLLLEAAEQSIDAQYYFVLDDVTGHLFIRELLRAADRGVRVRLLLDDIATQGYDLGMAALDSHPNFEIRIFNPFSQRRARYLNLRDLIRINRRMHNKQFIVDNRAIILGGRNIGAEYFAENEEMNFADLDVLGFGPVAEDGSRVFDQYWNYDYALPVGALVAKLADPGAELLALRARLDGSLESLVETPYAGAVERGALDLVRSKTTAMGWYPYELVADPPSKGREDIDVSQTIVGPLSSSIKTAKREFILISPYFVPRKSGIERFRKLRERGVAVTVVTNSLAATDVAAVHSGYMPARKPLLKMGVNLYEVRADADVPGVKKAGIGHSRASLHIKAYVVDRSKMFVGSFNFDPRSAYINTEMGIILDAPELAAESAKYLLQKTTQATYQVVLTENNRLRWIGSEDGQPIALNKEPQTSFWQRFMAGFMRILPIKGQL